MRRLLHTFMVDRRGATAIEYGLIATLIGCAILLPLSTVGSEVSATLVVVSDLVTNQ
jgi:pilus assembly protein Flp/PilA